ncbi:MAG TPA: hypothetical protein VF605_08215 [Allosphingosinicella sp.]
MTASPFPACWTAQDARAIFVTEALEGGDAIFLATHTPITGFDVAGTDAADIRDQDEQSVLDALSSPERRHAFCVVHGEPGSGKSHLIRWLSVNWPAGGDVKLLLRRADGSLEGALRQLKERLPPEFEPLFDNLGQRHRAAIQGRANIFASTLADTLEPDHFDRPIGDEDWCAAHAPADLVGYPSVKKAWRAPADILALLEGAGGERNSATASFNLFHIESLAAACANLRPPAISARAYELQRRLAREAETIRSYREQQWLPDELAAQAAEHFPHSLALVRALNNRRNDAIQNVLGVSAEGLKTLFRSVRQALQARGQRLVLLLEDITSWEGLDDSLIDVLVFNAEARGDEAEADVCPLISVVGVTPDYYERLQGNYRQRITHEIKLGQSTGGLQDVATLREADDRRSFAARYLSAVRAGTPALEAWREGLRQGSMEPPPNICDGCSRQATCFRIFGEEAGIGLFPFTADALERFFDALKENDNGQTWRTPRGMLQAVLNPNLAQPESIEERRFPVALIESTGIRSDRRSDTVLSNRLERIVANRILVPEEEARMRRMLAYWADPARADTHEVDGELSFAGAKRSLFEAFGLDWLGGEAAGEEPAAAAPVEPTEPFFAPDPEEENDPAAAAAPSVSAPRSPALRETRPPIVPPKPRRLTANRDQLEQYRHDLRGWAKGGSIANGAGWNRILFELVQNLDPRKLGVAPPLFEKIITPERVKLQGSSARLLDYLIVDAEPWARDGLEAYLALKFDKSVSREDAAFHRRNLAVMMRRLEALVVAYLDRRIPRLASGERWSPAAAIAQILTARAWLRGTLDPSVSTLDHVSAILSDEPEVLSDPKARSMPWQEWLTQTDKWHDRLRDELRSMVTLSIADGSGSIGLTDSSEIAGAIQRMRDTARGDEVPAEDGGLPELMRRVRELAAQWRDKRAAIDRTEAAQLKGRVESLYALLRGNSIAHHFNRLDACITAVSDLMPDAAPQAVSSWKMALPRVRSRLSEGAGERVEDLIADFDDPERGLPAKAALRAGWLARVPARDLEDFLALANLGEKVIEQLIGHARDCVREASGAGSLQEVRKIGASLKEASGLAAEPEGQVP